MVGRAKGKKSGKMRQKCLGDYTWSQRRQEQELLARWKDQPYHSALHSGMAFLQALGSPRLELAFVKVKGAARTQTSTHAPSGQVYPKG